MFFKGGKASLWWLKEDLRDDVRQSYNHQEKNAEISLYPLFLLDYTLDYI